MSSTNRGNKRSPSDNYVTAPWTVNRLLDEYGIPDSGGLPGGRWLECCAGDGQIIRTVKERRTDIRWSACELREDMKNVLAPLVDEHLVIGDFLQTELAMFGGEKFNVIFTNPPFRIAGPVLRHCMALGHVTVLLLRLNFWGSDDRQPFLSEYPPMKTFVLPNRPIFSTNKKGKIGSDSPEYAWMIWQDYESYQLCPQRQGEIKVLARTSLEERRQWMDILRLRAGEALKAEQEYEERHAATG